jgi:hypothetical protein
MTNAKKAEIKAEFDRLGSVDFGTKRFWGQWHLYGYAGVIHHIVQMAEEHYITTRKATELIEFAVRWQGAMEYDMPEPPPAPWKEYLLGNHDSSEGAK